MIKEKVKSIMQRVFEIETVPDNISQSNNGNWDSLRHLDLVVSIEEDFNFSLEPTEIEQMTSLENIISVVESKI